MAEQMEMNRKSGIVAIAGRPNAGKSTILNRVLGTAISIVTPKAQTTRERVQGILTEPRGQIVFVDTPGIHQAKAGGINEYMVKEARVALDQPDLIWYLMDPESKLEHEEAVLKLLGTGENAPPVFLLWNKTDVRAVRLGGEQTEKFREKIRASVKERGIPLAGEFAISAKTGRGVPELMERTWEQLKPGTFLYEDDPEVLSDRPLRFFVAEKIREQLYLCLGEELPYSCAVKIEKFEESTKPIRIEATILVERDSQKGMVVGAGGRKIKEIGQSARKTIEELVGEKIFLGLRVDVLKDWSKDAKALREMGYLT